MVKKLAKSDFAVLLKRLREKRELTAEELAEKAKIDRTYISKIENKNYLPSYDIAEKICDILKSDQLKRVYMLLKYPNETISLSSGLYEKSLHEAISRMLMEGKSKNQIVDYFVGI